MSDVIVQAIAGQTGQRVDWNQSGRWDNPAKVQIGSRQKDAALVLRLDPPEADPRLISGDVFADLDIAGAVPKLGGRRDWAYSFVADLKQAHYAKDRIAVPCEVSAVQRGGHDELNHKATLDVKLRADGTLDTVKLYMMVQDAGQWNLASEIMSDGFEEPSPIMRRLRLDIALTTQVAGNSEMTAAIEMLADPDAPLGIAQTLAADGIAADVFIARQATGLPGLTIEPTSGHYQEHVERLVPYVGAYFRGKMLDETYDWAHAFVFATHDPGSVPDEDRELPNYGESFGLGTALSRFNSRHGAVINATSLAGEVGDVPDHIEDPVERLAYSFRFTAIHELSHLLNIPHAWERAMGHRMLGQSDPGAATWSNYPTAHPFGAAAFLHFGTLDRDQNYAVQSARAKTFYTDFNNRFDRLERSFVHHAPFVHIAQGGRTFLDRSIPAPSFQAPQDTGRNLSIMVATDGGLKPIDHMTLFNYYWHDNLDDGAAQSTTLYEYPVVPAWIVLRDGDAPVRADANFFDFETESGAVQINVASAKERRVSGRRQVVTYSEFGQPDPAPGPFLPVFPQSFIAAQEVFAPGSLGLPEPPPDPTQGLVAVPFPWIGRDLLFWQLNVAPAELHVQASFRSAKDRYNSPVVTLNFGGGCEAPSAIARKPLDRKASQFFAAGCATGLSRLVAKQGEAVLPLDFKAHPSTR